MTKTLLMSSASVGGLVPTMLERSRGRFLRGPDGHGDAAAGGGGDAAPADGGAAADAGGDKGGEAGAGAEGAGGEGGEAKPETLLGQAAAEADGADGEGEGDGGAVKGKDGEDADGKPKEGEGEDGAKLVVLGAPEAYEIKLPDAVVEAGMEFDKEAYDAVEPLFRELDLSNDAVNAVVAGYAEKVLPLLMSRADARAEASGIEMRTGWEKEAKADPEIGGTKFDETKAYAKQTMIRFGVKSDGPFLKLLEESGLGNHPDMLRMFANIGRLTGEANVDTDAGGKGNMRAADRIYGKPLPAAEK